MAQAFLSNQGTQTNLLVDTTGGTTSSGTSIPVMKVSVDAGGTYTTPWTGNVGVSSGTITTLPNLPQGSIQVTAGTIATLGTMGTLGLINTVTTVSSLTNGSIVVTAGTVVNNGGSAIAYGPAATAAAAVGNPLNIGGTDSGGTIRTIKVDSGGLQRVGIDSGTISVLPNLPGGSIAIIAGTIATLGTMGTLGLGTVQMTSGTLNVGTVVNNGGTVAQLTNGSIVVTAGSTIGTQQFNPLPAVNTISHAGTSGTLGIGTLVGTASIGVGTALYPTHVSILVLSGTSEVCLAFGSQTNGPQVIRHGLFPAGGGLDTDIAYPHGYGTTNSPLTYQIISGAGAVSWDVNYFIHT